MKTHIEMKIASNGVATVTLSRPEKHNAFDDAFIEQLKNTFIEIEQNSKVKVMVLAAEGRSFSAGADLAWMKRMADYSEQENTEDAHGLAIMLKTLNQLSKPTIARVQGAAFGGAVGLVSCCDIAVGTDAANFCLSEVRVGLSPATISPYIVAAIGQRAARRYAITAETINAQQALKLGLLSSIVDEDALDDEVRRFCDILLANGESAMATTKQLIRDIAQREIDDDLIKHTSRVIAQIRVSDEAQQKLAAFIKSRSKK